MDQTTAAPMTKAAALLAGSRKRCKDLLLAAVSLCLGIMIWFLVVGADQMDMTIQVPIEILNLPKQLVLYNQIQKEVSVTLRGPRSIMQELRSRTLSLPVDLAKAGPDTVVINTDSLPLPLPSGIAVLRVQPASITLSIDQLVQKQIPVIAETEGRVAAGYELKDIVLSPDRIPVAGPKTLLERQQALKTYAISLDGMTHSVTTPVHLNLSPELASLIGETTVAAKITVKEKIVEKIIHNIPVSIRDAEGPVTLKPDTVSIFASISESLLAETESPPTLFNASVYVGSGELPRRAQVEVFAVPTPGREQTVIKSHTPQEVEILPGSEPEPVQPEVKKQDKKKQKH